MKTFHKGGVHPNDNKLNADAPAQVLPFDGTYCILVSQHLGAPSTPIVKKGDKVKRGQPLTENTAFLSSVVHAPVSGTVQNVAEAPDAGNFARPAIFIQPDGDEAADFISDDPTLDREIRLSPAEIIERVKAMGIVGLGGACFPTHVKLSIPKDCKAEYLLVNGVECEPYLIDDYRLMLDKPDEILVGVSILMKALSVDKAIIGIEANKPKAIALLKGKAAAYDGISVEVLKMKYPQGAEKQLVKALTGREVPSGKLPINAGCVIQNVGTCFAVYEAVQKHKPLTERLVTVTGPLVKEPRNFWVKIGTPVSALVEACGGLPENTGKIIAGGPMMGKALPHLNVPVTKGLSALLLLPDEQAHRRTPAHCIRCGKCVAACPMGLEPYLLHAAVLNKRMDLYERHHITDCIECGCCQYTCPSFRPLLDTLRLGKNTVNQIIRNRNTTK